MKKFKKCNKTLKCHIFEYVRREKYVCFNIGEKII